MPLNNLLDNSRNNSTKTKEKEVMADVESLDICLHLPDPSFRDMVVDIGQITDQCFKYELCSSRMNVFQIIRLA